jgi:hypothetical protein
MLIHLWSVIALVILCAGWVLFQHWLKRVDPNGNHIERPSRGCGACTRRCEDEH